MPLNGHSYLVSQGWSGTGTGLRQGAISRPLAMPQKKNLAGLGKDRDEAFPFWDQLSIFQNIEYPVRDILSEIPILSSLFTAAATAILIKISSEDSDSDGVSQLLIEAVPLPRV